MKRVLICMWLAGASVFIDVLPTTLSIWDHFTHECAYYYPYPICVRMRMFNPDLFSSLQQLTIRSKLQRSGKHKIKQVKKSCRSSLDFHSAVVSHGSINLDLLGKKLLPTFLNIGCIVFDTEIKKHTLRASYMSFGQDYPWIIALRK
jgi:hypothetical protein